MSKTVIYECPKCGDRKLVDYNQQLPPTVWCSCDESDITMMEPNPDTD